MADRPSILVPVQVLEGQSVPEGVADMLGAAHVVLLGYHVIPEQTAPGQAQLQFEERATERLDEYSAIFEDAGATVDTRLVFTHNDQQTIDRMIDEHDCEAVLVPNATGPIEDVLVPVRGTVGADRLAHVVAGVFGESSVLLYHVADGAEDSEAILDSVRERLVEQGMDASAIRTLVEHDRPPLEAILERSDDFDAVVMGESDPSLVTFVFGMPTEQVAERFLGPVLVVQREAEPTDEAE